MRCTIRKEDNPKMKKIEPLNIKNTSPSVENKTTQKSLLNKNTFLIGKRKSNDGTKNGFI